MRLMDVKMANAFFNFSPLGIENLFFLPTISEISPAVWKAHLEISRHTVQSNPDPRHTRDSSSARDFEDEIEDRLNHLDIKLR